MDATTTMLSFPRHACASQSDCYHFVVVVVVVVDSAACVSRRAGLMSSQIAAITAAVVLFALGSTLSFLSLSGNKW